MGTLCFSASWARIGSRSITGAPCRGTSKQLHTSIRQEWTRALTKARIVDGMLSYVNIIKIMF